MTQPNIQEPCEVHRQTLSAAAGHNTWTVNLSGSVSSGLYLLEADWGAGQERFKLVIE